MLINELIKAVALRCGVEVRPFLPTYSHVAHLKAMLSWHRVNLVFDVGANAGQFGKQLRNQVAYTGRIVSFEPMGKEYQALCKAAAKDRLWEVATRTAVGSEAGTVTINIACNSMSSSILPMLEAHTTAAPASRYKETEVVPVDTLDSLCPQYMRDDSVAFLKIDTQGYESEVLQGATQTLARVVGVQLELSLIPLYADQKLMPEMVAAMTALGFNMWAVEPAFLHPDTGRMLQVDATFFRDVPSPFERTPS